LQENFKSVGFKGENVPGPSTPSGIQMDEEESDEGEDEDEDMEEVS